MFQPRVPDLPRQIKLDVPYHIQKRIDLAGTGAVCDGTTVVVEIRDIETGEFRGKQFIKPDGEKRFSPGMKKHGAGTFIGEKSDRLYVCEGWADAVVVHIITGQQAVFALDANTLPETTKQLKAKGYNVVVAADNDEAGRKAVKAAGLPYVSPPVVKDWWDLWDTEGEAAVRAALENIVDPLTVSMTSGYQIWGGDELFNADFPPTEWLLKPYLPQPTLALIAGAPKVGKSWIAMEFGLQVAEAGYGTLYIATEDNAQRIKARLRRLRPFAVSPQFKVLPMLSNEQSLPHGAEALELITNFVSENPNLRCIIIDTIAAIRNPSEREKNYDVTSTEFGNLRKLAHDLGVAIVAVHHNRKSTGMETSPVEMILGSTGISATVETIMVLQRQKGTQDLNMLLTGKDIEEQELTFKWTANGYQSAGVSVEAALGDTQRAVLNVIRQQPRCTQHFIGEEIKRDKSQVSKAVGRLIECGLVQRLDDGTLAPNT
ncbi:AAA family ATPase [Rhodobacterales bacterium HKCCD6035]|nr:AAA family ATPase [Rhodobacterales bacterium HKCCD6035]